MVDEPGTQTESTNTSIAAAIAAAASGVPEVFLNPVVVAAFFTVLGALLTASMSYLAGLQQSYVDTLKTAAVANFDKSKYDSSLIWHAIRTGNADQAATNLQFLLDLNLISDPQTRQHLEAYLKTRRPGAGAWVPPAH